MKVKFFLTVHGPRFCQATAGGCKNESITYSCFIKSEEIDYNPDFGWEKLLMPDDKRTGKVTRIIMSPEGQLLSIYLEGGQFLPTEFEFLRGAGWEKIPYNDQICA